VAECHDDGARRARLLRRAGLADERIPLELGGRPVGDNQVEGDGWRATLRAAERRSIGSLCVGGATVVFEGEQATLDALFERLHWKTLRGGG